MGRGRRGQASSATATTDLSGARPSKEWDGTRWYDSQGRCHREDGPAIELNTGGCVWYRHGQRHREDGPALIYGDGRCEWWLDNELLSEEEWRVQMHERSLASVVVSPGPRIRPSALST